MSIISRYFNTHAAAPSWRVAKITAGAFLAATAAAVVGSPVIADVSGWVALSSAFVSVASWINGIRKGFSLRSAPPSPGP